MAEKLVVPARCLKRSEMRNTNRHEWSRIHTNKIQVPFEWIREDSLDSCRFVFQFLSSHDPRARFPHERFGDTLARGDEHLRVRLFAAREEIDGGVDLGAHG